MVLVVAACVLVWRWRRRRVPTLEPEARLLVVGDLSAELLSALRARADIRVVGDQAAVEDALRTFAADEIVVLDPTKAEILRARFVVPVRAVTAEDYLPETASR